MDVSRRKSSMTLGIDLGDKYNFLCLLDTESGEVIEEGRLRITPEAFKLIDLRRGPTTRWRCFAGCSESPRVAGAAGRPRRADDRTPSSPRRSARSIAGAARTRRPY
jgi:hypothetical protein